MALRFSSMNFVSAARSGDETHRASVKLDCSNPIATLYSAASRAFSTSNCNTPTTPTIGADAVAWAEQLHDAFLGQFDQRLAQLLRFHRVVQPDPAEDFRREIRHADEGDILALGQRIADPQGAVVGDADDVAGEGLVGDLAFAREEELRRVQRNLLAGAHLLQPHAAHQPAGTDAREGDAVAVVAGPCSPGS